MDFSDFWQENKRFLSTVAAGAAVFLIGWLAIQSVYGDELSAARAERTRLERQLAESRYGAADRETARAENRELLAVLERLSEAVVFEARSGFEVALAETSHVNHYHRTIADVRDRLLLMAGRSNLFVDRDLGLPDLSPAREEDVERYLHGLDVVERVVEIALATGIERIDEIRIRPAPGTSDRPRHVERTRVELELGGSGLALTSFLVRTQRTGDGPLVVEEAELLPARAKNGKARLSVSLSVVQLHHTDDFTGGDA